MRMQTRRATDNRAERAGLVQPQTWNDADRTLEVVWTTGAPVERFGFGLGPFIETLEVSADALRLDRLNDGAPLLDSHNLYALSAVVGAVVPGSVRVGGGVGTCQVQLADTPDVAEIEGKIRAGLISKVSVGYIVHTYEQYEPDDLGDLPELRAIDWEPIEISLVAVPADPGAYLRSRS